MTSPISLSCAISSGATSCTASASVALLMGDMVAIQATVNGLAVGACVKFFWICGA